MALVFTPVEEKKKRGKGWKKLAVEPKLETTLWAAEDKLRGHMDAAEYKHVVLGLIFLKYISDAFRRAPEQTQGRNRESEERALFVKAIHSDDQFLRR